MAFSAMPMPPFIRLRDEASPSRRILRSVKGSKVECSINGAVVASYDKALLVTGGKLKSTDGTYGLRFAHNTDVMVTGLTMTKN